MYQFSDETTCRICFKKQDTVFSLFRKRQGISPCEKLNKIGLIAEENDSGPPCICCECLTELEITVNFLGKCEESNQILAEQFSRGLNSKEEIVVYKDTLIVEKEANDFYSENRIIKAIQDVHVESNDAVKPSKTLGLEDARCEECGSRRRCRHWSPPTTHVCPYCQRVFHKKYNFKLHVKRHSDERDWFCEKCGTSTVTQWLAARHCEPRPRRLCPVPGCGKTYTTVTNLNTHLRGHRGEKPFECGDCGKKFSNKDTLKNHMRIHTGVLPYVCPVCGKQFRTNKLSAHMDTHTGARYVCARAGCAKRLPSRLALQRHARAHAHKDALTHGGTVGARTSLPPHACPLCPSRYHHKQSLNKHMRKQHAQNSVPVEVETTEQTNEIHCSLLIDANVVE